MRYFILGGSVDVPMSYAKLCQYYFNVCFGTKKYWFIYWFLGVNISKLVTDDSLARCHNLSSGSFAEPYMLRQLTRSLKQISRIQNSPNFSWVFMYIYRNNSVQGTSLWFSKTHFLRAFYADFVVVFIINLTFVLSGQKSEYFRKTVNYGNSIFDI